MAGEKGLTRVYSYCETGKLTSGLVEAKFDFHHHPCVAPKPIWENSTYAVCKGRQTTLKQYIGLQQMKAQHGFEKPLMIQMTYALKHIHDAEKVVTALTEKNFKFSEDLKYVVLTNFDHTDPAKKAAVTENSNHTKHANMMRLAELFYWILSGTKLTGYEVDSKQLSRSQEPAIAAHLIQKMRETENFSADDVLKHPYFWNSMKKLNFICSVSQFYQSQMARSKNKFLTKKDSELFNHNKLFENWRNELEVKPASQSFPCHKIDAVTMLLKHFEDAYDTSYNGRPLFQIIRFIRNCFAHYWDNHQKHRSAKEVFELFGSENDGLWRFFNDKFPDCFKYAYDWAKRLQEYPRTKVDAKTVFQHYLRERAKISDLVHRTAM